MKGKIGPTKQKLVQKKTSLRSQFESDAIQPGHVPNAKDALMKPSDVSTIVEASVFEASTNEDERRSMTPGAPEQLEWDDGYNFAMTVGQEMGGGESTVMGDRAKKAAVAIVAPVAIEVPEPAEDKAMEAEETEAKPDSDMSGLDMLANVIISDHSRSNVTTPDVPTSDLIPETTDRPDVNDLISDTTITSQEAADAKLQFAIKEISTKAAEQIEQKEKEIEGRVQEQVETRVRARLSVHMQSFNVPETPQRVAPAQVFDEEDEEDEEDVEIIEAEIEVEEVAEAAAAAPVVQRQRKSPTDMLHALNARLTVTKHYITSMEETLHKVLTGTPSREAIGVALDSVTKIGAYTRDMDMLEQKINFIAQEHYGADALPENLFTVAQRSSELARRLRLRLQGHVSRPNTGPQHARAARQPRGTTIQLPPGQQVDARALDAVQTAVNVAMKRKSQALQAKDIQLRRQQAQMHKMAAAYKNQQVMINDMSMRLDQSMNQSMHQELNQSLRQVQQQNESILAQLNSSTAGVTTSALNASTMSEKKTFTSRLKRTFSSFRRKRTSTFNNASTPVADQQPRKRYSVYDNSQISIC